MGKYKECHRKNETINARTEEGMNNFLEALKTKHKFSSKSETLRQILYSVEFLISNNIDLIDIPVREKIIFLYKKS